MYVISSRTIDAPADLSRCRLGDARLDRRLVAISGALQDRPSESFPKAMADDAATEGFYRFLANKRVTWTRVFDAHAAATRERCVQAGVVLALHDTTLCQFGGEEVRKGACRTAKEKSGFWAHTCLAVSADGTRSPLGVLGMLPVVRLAGEEAKHSPGIVYEVESQRWTDLVGTVDDEMPDEVDIIHVMDSEGDFYDLFEFMVQQDDDFVVRMCQDRRVLTWTGIDRLFATLGTAELRLTRTARLSKRKKQPGKSASKRHARRDERVAALEVRTLSTNLLRPADSKAFLAGLHLNIVHVVEPDPPEGMEPVSWILVTRLPVDSVAQVEAIVDAYRARWLIEEWFKSLKTGCAYESRQLEGLDALLTAFALLAPVATRLLSLRWMARNEPTRPATDVLSDTEIACLRMLEQQKRRKLPGRPSVAHVMLAIARLGGFLKQNKTPGWQVLGRGWEDFQKMHSVYALMLGGQEM